MIERAIINYLSGHPIVGPKLTKEFETIPQIYYRRAPADVEFPWLLVTNSGGSRKRLTYVKTEPKDTLSLYLDTDDQFLGKEIADDIKTALDNYRGNMSGEVFDSFITCDTIRDLDNYQGSFRFLITIHVQYVEDTTFPT